MAVTGNVNPEEVLKWGEKDLGRIPPGGGDEGLERPVGKSAKNEVAKDVEQVHFCIGGDGCSIFDEELYTMGVLDGLLGGGMSSRLFQEIREKRGLAYAVGSYTLSYSAGGAYTVYGGTSHANWEEVQKLVRAEFDKMMSSPVDEDELERTKRNICGGIVLALEGMSGRMMRMSKNELYHKREIPLDETIGKINAVTTAKVQELAQRVLSEESVSTTAIGPFGD